MAKRGRPGVESTSRLNVTAERVGAALGHLAARIDVWKKQRDEIAGDLRLHMTNAQAMLAGLGHKAQAEGEKVAAAAAVALENVAPQPGKPGRRRGYKQTAAARRKMRLAWKRRKAAQALAKKAVVEQKS